MTALLRPAQEASLHLTRRNLGRAGEPCVQLWLLWRLFPGSVFLGKGRRAHTETLSSVWERSPALPQCRPFLNHPGPAWRGPALHCPGDCREEGQGKMSWGQQDLNRIL